MKILRYLNQPVTEKRWIQWLLWANVITGLLVFVVDL